MCLRKRKFILLRTRGGMVFTFDKSKGLAIGASLVEDDKIELAKQLEAEVCRIRARTRIRAWC